MWDYVFKQSRTDYWSLIFVEHALPDKPQVSSSTIARTMAEDVPEVRTHREYLTCVLNMHSGFYVISQLCLHRWDRLQHLEETFFRTSHSWSPSKKSGPWATWSEMQCDICSIQWDRVGSPSHCMSDRHQREVWGVPGSNSTRVRECLPRQHVPLSYIFLITKQRFPGSFVWLSSSKPRTHCAWACRGLGVVTSMNWALIYFLNECYTYSSWTW